MLLFGLLLALVMILMLLLVCLNLFIIEKGFTIILREEVTSYECGFEHNSLSRIPFSIRYFLLTVVFLIFDLEIVMLVFIPYSLIGSISLSSTILISIGFIIFLLLGLFYEWVDGSLDWVM